MSGPRSAKAPADVVPLTTAGTSSGGRGASSNEAFERFFAAHFTYAVHNLRRLGVRECDIDDVAQDVFVAVHRHFADYDPQRAAKAWLFAFISRLASNYRNLARIRRQQGLDDTVAAASDDDPESNAHRTSRSQFVRDVLLAMSEERRTALILHDLEELTAPEIALALELPLNTVYSRVRRAREDFKRIAERRLPREDR